jgi:Mg2+-importing ATPase
VSVSALSLAIPYLGPLSSAFGFVPLSAFEMVAVFAIVAGYVVATEASKAWFYGGLRPSISDGDLPKAE